MRNAALLAPAFKEVQASANQQMDELFEILCYAMQLTPSQHGLAETRYKAVCDWLGAPDSFLAQWSPQLYPQGSVRLRTTVRPRTYSEHDVDLICELAADPDFYRNPMAIYELVEARLKQSPHYRDKTERFKRCIRINYAGEFHLDVTPACPDPRRPRVSTRLLVPDRKIQFWKPSDPVAYAGWFGAEAAAVRKAARAQMNAEPFPKQESAKDKAPLRRSVQLMKRHRDVYFDGDEDAPRSITLTTLAARHYGGEELVSDCLLGLLERLQYEIDSTPGIIHVPNPTLPEEKFCEAWRAKPESYEKFKRFIRSFRAKMHRLLATVGTDEIAKRLAEMFGEGLSKQAVDEYARQVQEKRKDGNLHYLKKTGSIVVPGVAVAASPHTRPVRNNNFFGDDTSR